MSQHINTTALKRAHVTYLFGTHDGEDVAVQRVVVREGGAALVGEGVLGQQLLVAVRVQQRRQRLQAIS